jgi:hypothetical protein
VVCSIDERNNSVVDGGKIELEHDTPRITNNH